MERKTVILGAIVLGALITMFAASTIKTGITGAQVAGPVIVKFSADGTIATVIIDGKPLEMCTAGMCGSAFVNKEWWGPTSAPVSVGEFDGGTIIPLDDGTFLADPDSDTTFDAPADGVDSTFGDSETSIRFGIDITEPGGPGVGNFIADESISLIVDTDGDGILDTTIATATEFGGPESGFFATPNGWEFDYYLDASGVDAFGEPVDNVYWEIFLKSGGDHIFVKNPGTVNTLEVIPGEHLAIGETVHSVQMNFRDNGNTLHLNGEGEFFDGLTLTEGTGRIEVYGPGLSETRSIEEIHVVTDDFAGIEAMSNGEIGGNVLALTIEDEDGIPGGLVSFNLVAKDLFDLGVDSAVAGTWTIVVSIDDNVDGEGWTAVFEADLSSKRGRLKYP